MPFPKGHIMSEEIRRKISKTMKRRLKGEKHHLWRGGKTISEMGYILIKKPNHPFRNSRGYVREHRIILEIHLGYMLCGKECPHHINRIKNDNRLENLILFKNQSAHSRFHKNPNNVRPSEILFDGRK